jgi:hypothetical protein
MQYRLAYDTVSCPLPTLDAAIKGFSVLIPHLDIVGCLTGSARFFGSGSVKDNLLVFRKGRKFGFEFVEGDRSFELQIFEPFIIFIGADEKG